MDNQDRESEVDKQKLPVHQGHNPEVSPDYDDGKLVNGDEEYVPNYLRHTETSARQAGLSYSAARGWGQEAPMITEVAQTNAEELSDDSQPYAWGEDRQASDPMGTVEPDSPYTESDDNDAAAGSTSDTSLGQRSRLEDAAFYSTPISQVNVPVKTQYRILRTGLRYAQEPMWSAVRSHWPEIQRRYFLEGPQELRFGREELDNVFGDISFPGETSRKSKGPKGLAYWHLLEVVQLRNAVCHPRHLSPAKIDELLKTAQVLAVALGDETKAFKVRRLRDTLQAEAEKAHFYIEVVMPLNCLPGGSPTCLPEGRPWALHHQRLLRRCRLPSMKVGRRRVDTHRL